MISIIIRTFNEEKYLCKALENVLAQEIEVPIEVIIVDSGSEDDTLKIARSFNLQIVHIKKSNFSFGRSLNYGCSAAKGDLFVFVSAHCIPVENYWLQELVNPFNNEMVAMTYGRQVGWETTKYSENQVFRKYFPSSIENEQGGFFCNNACSSIRASLWDEYKFNEKLTGLEDLDWAKYFYNKSYIIQYVPESLIYHIHEESWRKVKIRYEREAIALKEIMPEIHFNFFDMLISIFRGIISDSKMALKDKKLNEFMNIMRFRICQFYGSYKGNHSHRSISKQKKQNYFYP